MNKQGQLMQLFILMIVAMVALVLLGGLWYGWDLLDDKVSDIGSTSSGLNITDVSNKTIGAVNSALPILRFLAFGLIIGMIASIFISNYFRRVHPVFVVVYIFIVIGAVIASVPISNAHDGIIEAEQMGGKLGEFTAVNFIIANLPIWVAVIGMVGAIFLFAGIIIDRNQGGSF